MAQNLYEKELEDLEKEGPPTRTAVNPYEEVLTERATGGAAALRATMSQAVQKTPEQAAKVSALSQRTGLPLSVVDRNFDSIEKRAKVEETEYTRMLAERPNLANWLQQNPTHAAVAQDEIPRLEAIEDRVRFGARLRAGIDQLQGAWYSSAEWLGDVVNDQGLETYGREGRRREATERAGRGPMPSWTAGDIRDVGDFVDWAKGMIGEQLPVMTPPVVGGIVGGALGSIVPGAGTVAGTSIGAMIGAFVPSAILGIGEAQQILKEKDEKASAPLAVFIGGSAIAAFDTALPGHIGSRLVIGFGKETAEQIARKALMSTVRPALIKTTAKEGIVSMATEGVTEAIQEAIGEVTGAIGTGQPVDPKIWSQMVEAAVGGALLGGVFGTVTGAVEAFGTRKQRESATAQHHAQLLQSLGTAIEQAETGKRAPGALASFLESSFKGGPLAHVYAPIQQFTEYWQNEGVDPAAVAQELTGDARAYQTAVKTGEQLVIPTARYLSVIGSNPKHNGFFSQEVSFRPGEFNAREAAAYQAELAAQADITVAPPVDETPIASVTSALVDELQRAGMTPATAETIATFHTKAFGNLAARAKVDPAGLHERYGLKVDRPDLPRTNITPNAGILEGTSSEAIPIEEEAPLEVEEIQGLLETEGAVEALERRGPVQEGPPAGQEERRKEFPELETILEAARREPDAPIGQLVGALSTPTARMLTEDPSLRRRAAELQTARAATEEVTLAAQAVEGETISRDVEAEGISEGARSERRAAVRRIPQSTPLTRRESAKALNARRTEHYGELFRAVYDAAKSLDPAVKRAALKKEFDDRVNLIEELDREYAESGQSSRSLLEAIAAAGGISFESEKKGGGMVGELKWIRESPQMGPFGAFGGVKGVWRQKVRGAGKVSAGRTLDDMVGLLRQDERFNYIEDVNDLLLALEDVSREGAEEPGVTLPGTEEIARRVGIHLDRMWWRGPEETELAQERGLFELEPAEDVLETGEVQPRLPEAGQVREAEVPTPELEAPFALTPEVARGPRGKQGELFQPAYHGSPHVFEKFSLHAIGSGEGHAAFGWGLYFASQREVAELYRTQLAGKKESQNLIYNDVPVYDGLANRMSQEERRGLGEVYARMWFKRADNPNAIAEMKAELERSVENLRGWIAEGTSFSGSVAEDKWRLGDYEAALAVLEKYGDGLKIRAPFQAGRTFKVEIPEQEDYLDWGKPLAEQSPKVQAALEKAGLEIGAVRYPTLKNALRTLNSARVQDDARRDIGTREAVFQGHLYASTGNEAEFRKWYVKNQNLMTDVGKLAPTSQLGEQAYEELRHRLTAEQKLEWKDGPEAASRKLSSLGIAGIAYLDGNSRDAGEGTYNFVVFDDRLVQVTEYFQTEAEPRLSAIHQMTSDNLRFADKFGGLAVPSIAVTPEGHGALSSYGEVTLIGGMKLADPELNPVFDSDTYTATFPKGEYGKASEAGVKGLVERFRVAATEFDDMPLVDAFWTSGRDKPDPHELVSLMRRSLAAQAVFLREQGLEVTPQTRPAPMGAPFVEMPAFQKFLSENGGTQAVRKFAYDDLEYRQRMAAAVKTSIEEWVAKQEIADDLEGLEDRLMKAELEAWIDDDGLVPFGYGLRLERAINAIGRMDVDYALTREHIGPMLEGRESEFQNWIDNQIIPIFPAPKIRVAGKKVDYTLQSVTEHMISQRLQGATKPLAHGEGFTRAVVATRFTDLAAMRRAAAKQIQDPEAIKAARDKAQELLQEWRGEVIRYSTARDWRGSTDTWAALDASMKGIANYVKSSRGNEIERMTRALGREGFVGVPVSIVAKGVVAADAFMAAPVPYFESKPQRSVGLEEFSGAIIPDNAAQEVRDILDRRGVPYVTYPADNPTARAKVLNEFREQLSRGGEDVYFQPGKRGSIRFGPDRKFTISLFQKADLSTFLHEIGHFYLEVFGDLVDQIKAADPATLDDTQKQMLTDYEALLEDFGVSSRTEITVKHHEKFARAWEKYLMTGKAPSIELRSVFARFRAWLVGVYGSLRGLNVELSEPVRQVMDRLIASDAAIQEAKEQGNISPMFTTAESAGWSDADFSLYRGAVEEQTRQAREELDKKVLVEVQREASRIWKEQKAAIRLEVEREFHRQPVYQALFAMQRGTYPDGTPLEGEGGEPTPMKLSRKAIVEQYGEARLKKLPKPYVYKIEGGEDPQTAAEIFGFTSADELLTAIEEAAPMGQAIEAEVDKRMLEQNGSMMLDGSIYEKAQAAVMNEGRDRVIRMELKALADLRRLAQPQIQQAVRREQKERSYERRWLEAEAKLRIAIAEGRKQVEIDRLQNEVDNLKRKAEGGPAAIAGAIPPDHVIRESAKERIAQTKVRNLRPQVFWSAARKAARDAIDMAAMQNFHAAILYKQQELVNLALYREAAKALEDTDRRVKAARDLAKPAARKRLGLAGQTYLDQIDGILDRFEFAQVSKTALDRRASIANWIAGLEGDGVPVELPEEVLNDARRVNYRELSYEELVGVTDGIASIVHLSRLKNRLIKTKEARELNELAADLAASIRDKGKGARRKIGLETRLPEQERYRLVNGIFAAHRKMSSLARQLDGFEDGGLFWSSIVRPLNEAGDRESTMNADATRRLGEIVKRAYPGRQQAALYTKQYIPAINDSLTRMGRIMVAMNWGNDGNRQRIKTGNRWNDGQVQAVLDTLDARDWRFVQDVWDYLDSYWEQIAAKQERVVGIAPERVVPTPFQTPYGMMRGGYFPLKYDDRRSARAQANLDAETASFAKHAAYANATTKRGHTEARAKSVNLPVRLDFGVLFEHVEQVIHDLSHHEALIDVGRVLGHKSVQEAVYEVIGDEGYKQFKAGIRDVAFGDVPAKNGFERGINHLRAGATVSALGWNLVTTAMQPIGLTQSLFRIGPKWVFRGMKRWTADAARLENTAGWIVDKSEMMRNRFATQNREINEIRNKLGVNTGKLSGWVDEVLSKTTFDTVTRQGIADSFFWFIQQGQRIADIPTWLGAYEKAMEQGKDESTSIAIADQAVLDSQAGGQIKDLAQVQRGGPMLRLWTAFYSFFSSTYNLAAEARWARASLKNPIELGRLAVDYLILFVVPASLSYAMYSLLGRTDDDEDPLEGLIRANATYIMGTMLGLREFSGAVQGYFGYEGPAGSRFFATGSRLTKQVAQGELDAAFWKALNDTAGILLHYPAGQTRRTLEGMAALMEGKTKNPVVMLTGPQRE